MRDGAHRGDAVGVTAPFAHAFGARRRDIGLPPGEAHGINVAVLRIGFEEAFRAPWPKDIPQFQLRAGHIGQRITERGVFPIDNGRDANVLPHDLGAPEIAVQ